jgi:hypothetical protein
MHFQVLKFAGKYLASNLIALDCSHPLQQLALILMVQRYYCSPLRYSEKFDPPLTSIQAPSYGLSATILYHPKIWLYLLTVSHGETFLDLLSLQLRAPRDLEALVLHF